ncbi:hypothetical protein J3L18_00085 [Mucilaginibacter gossypii]|uniref:hypothetical protein n=1 Tax=Mucilaginibacter gossypii TaxID=551996 RepID=UPI00101A9903|nr:MULTISPECIES: hypothetical protein [Mucilaginibacter]QTE37501.1 hypothetical protein J3L18_00085 [Mucilaginibacter gossypii]
MEAKLDPMLPRYRMPATRDQKAIIIAYKFDEVNTQPAIARKLGISITEVSRTVQAYLKGKLII